MSQHPAAIAALLLVLTPWTANAQTGAQNFSQNSLSQGSQAHSITVYGGDLNLATGAGRATLAARIGSAVESVCGFPHSAREAAAYATCSREARGGAETQAASLAARAGKIAGGTEEARTMR